jgi:hypothetical protein
MSVCHDPFITSHQVLTDGIQTFMLSIIPIEPFGRRVMNIFYRMTGFFRNEYLISGFRDNLFAPDGQAQFPFNNSDQLVGRMNEIIPLPPGRINKHIARIPPLIPGPSHLLASKWQRKLFTGQVFQVTILRAA